MKIAFIFSVLIFIYHGALPYPAFAMSATVDGDPGKALQSHEEATGCADMSVEKALEAVRTAYMDAVNSADLEALVSLHTRDSISMPAGMAPVRGRDALRELIEGSLSAMPEGSRFEFVSQEIRVADDWAVERGVTKATDAFPAGKYVMLYEREADGCWRIAWTITNTDQPPPPR